MTFSTTAQTLYVIDPISPASQLPAADRTRVDSHSTSEHQHHLPQQLMHEMKHPFGGAQLEVTEPVDIEIVVEEIPGAPPGTKDPEPIIEVAEEPLHAEEKEDDNDAKKGKGKNEKWDWAAHGPHGFVAWIQGRLSDVPKHSGFDTSGLERACSYLEKLDSEISKAMRMDLDGELDANKVEEIRSKLDEGLARLHSRIDKVKDSKKTSRKKKKADYIIDEEGFVKEAQKITGVQGIYVTVPLLISSIARICVNGMVSAGHDCEAMSAHLIKKYSLNDREQLELRQLLFDMGVAIRIDMGRSPDEPVLFSDNKGLNWNQNFPS
jgi:hypothetical protein